MGSGGQQGAPELLVLTGVLGLVVSVCVAISQAILGTLSTTTLTVAGASLLFLMMGLAFSPVETASRRHAFRTRISGRGAGPLTSDTPTDDAEPMTPAEIWSITRIAIAVKVVVSVVHLWVMENVYGVADLFRYHEFGQQVARQAQSGGVELIQYGGRGTTTFINTVAWQYIFLGTNLHVQAIVSSMIALTGAAMAAAAARRVVPVHRQRTATLLILFSPSMLFWSATIGKDAYMSLGGGAFLLALAMGLDDRRIAQALPLAIFGLIWCSMFRAHVGFAMAAAVVPGLMLHRAPDAVVRGKNLKPLAIGIASVGLLFGASRLEAMFGISASAGGLSSLAAETSNVRADSGGTILRGAGPVTSPLDVPMAVLTTNFRPLPFDGWAPQQLIQSLENVAYLGVTIQCLRRRKEWFAVIRQSETLSIGVFYILFFSLGFATLDNAGTLARQRLQWLPMLLMLLCAVEWKSSKSTSTRSVNATAPDQRTSQRSNEPTTVRRPAALW